MRQLAKVIDREDLVRDMSTQAVLNIDQTAVRRHEKRMFDLQKDHNREQEFRALKSEIGEIKSLLEKLVSNKCGN